MSTASATRTALRPPSPGPTQTGSSGVSAATGTTPLHRPAISVPYPTPKVGQYVLTSSQFCHPNVEKCFGFQGQLRCRNGTPSPPEDLVVISMMPRQYIVAGTTRLKMSNAYFHANEGCIKCRLPNFPHTLVDIQLGLPPLIKPCR